MLEGAPYHSGNVFAQKGLVGPEESCIETIRSWCFVPTYAPPPHWVEA